MEFWVSARNSVPISKTYLSFPEQNNIVAGILCSFGRDTSEVVLSPEQFVPSP